MTTFDNIGRAGSSLMKLVAPLSSDAVLTPTLAMPRLLSTANHDLSQWGLPEHRDVGAGVGCLYHDGYFYILFPKCPHNNCSRYKLKGGCIVVVRVCHRLHHVIVAPTRVEMC